MNLPWVFAYGSNMHVGDLKRWFLSQGKPWEEPRVEPAHLPGHRLVWNYYSPARQGGAANVEPAPAESVQGLLLRVSAEALTAIDIKEGHPARYHRRKCAVIRLDREMQAWVYFVQPAFRAREFTPPRAEYLALMRGAAETHGFCREYFELLDQIPVQRP